LVCLITARNLLNIFVTHFIPAVDVVKLDPVVLEDCVAAVGIVDATFDELKAVVIDETLLKLLVVTVSFFVFEMVDVTNVGVVLKVVVSDVTPVVIEAKVFAVVVVEKDIVFGKGVIVVDVAKVAVVVVVVAVAADQILNIEKIVICTLKLETTGPPLNFITTLCIPIKEFEKNCATMDLC
jgi:hypothetical protein